MRPFVHVRCPDGNKLFARMAIDPDSNVLVEMACRECRKVRQAAGENVALVLHVFDGSGACVDTLTVLDTRR